MRIIKALAVVAASLLVSSAPAEDPSAGAAPQNPPVEDQPGHLELPVPPPVDGAAVEGGVATAPAGRIVRGNFVSVQVNVASNGNDVLNDAANEPSIAVDPTNPARMAVGWRQFDTIQSDFRQSGIAYSDDGGLTWTSPGATTSRLGVLEPGVFSSDPVLEFDADGRFYYYALQPNRGPGDWACYLYRSDDGGATWPLEMYAYGGDKAWMTVDRSGGIGHGNLYFAWSPFAGCCFPDLFTRSTTEGASFMSPIGIPQSPRWGTLTVDPDGRLFLVGVSGSAIYVLRSSNAQNPLGTPTFDQVAEVNLGGTVTSGTGPNPGGLLGQLWIASDHSNGPTRGNLYVLGSVNPPGEDPLDVMFSRSTDGGATWSDPVRVNDDSLITNAWQWFGTMSVAPNGRIDAIWNDTRNSGQDRFSELHYAYSLDAGETWSVNEPASPMFDSHIGWPSQNKIGDYYDMISDNAGAHVAYAATFNGGHDVYYLRIYGLDCNGNGIPDVDDLAKGTSDDCNANDLPDECDPDCNHNELVDACETFDGVSPDCNENSIPDDCDPDFDSDGLIDACDSDIDDDGVLNETDVCDFTRPGLPVTSVGRAIGDAGTGPDTTCNVDLSDLFFFVHQCFVFSGPSNLVASFCTDRFSLEDDQDVDLIDFAGFQRAFGP